MSHSSRVVVVVDDVVVGLLLRLYSWNEMIEEESMLWMFHDHKKKWKGNYPIPWMPSAGTNDDDNDAYDYTEDNNGGDDDNNFVVMMTMIIMVMMFMATTMMITWNGKT